MEHGLAKKLLEAPLDDGEDGQTNGVLQHYAYRYVRWGGRRGEAREAEGASCGGRQPQTPPTHPPPTHTIIPHRAITFAERFLTSNPPCLEQAGRWFHTGKESKGGRRTRVPPNTHPHTMHPYTALVFLEVLKAGARTTFTDGT